MLYTISAYGELTSDEMDILHTSAAAHTNSIKKKRKKARHNRRTVSRASNPIEEKVWKEVKAPVTPEKVSHCFYCFSFAAMLLIRMYELFISRHSSNLTFLPLPHHPLSSTLWTTCSGFLPNAVSGPFRPHPLRQRSVIQTRATLAKAPQSTRPLISTSRSSLTATPKSNYRRSWSHPRCCGRN